MSNAIAMTDGDADVGKSPLSPLLKSFPKIVSPVSSVTMVWLGGVSMIGSVVWWTGKPIRMRTCSQQGWPRPLPATGPPAVVPLTTIKAKFTVLLD